jgi:hypothetical protein
MTRLVLDAGAFIAFEKGDRRVRARLATARLRGMRVVTSSPAIAQVWRDAPRQVLLGQLIAAMNVDAPSETAARSAGVLLAKTRTHDVVDALVVGCVRDGDTVLTSDPGDIEVLLEAAGVDATIETV